MISYLKGKIIKKNDKGIILDIGNIGYFVNLTNPTLAEIQETQSFELFIHTHVREDMLDLYGFQTYEDLIFFKNLISITGIGPRLALDILSVPIEKVKGAILNEDVDFIKQIPGIGPKTAKRIILELKSKIETEDIDREYQGLTPINKDATEALLRLGYNKNQITKTLKDIPENLKEAEEIITYFLKNS